MMENNAYILKNTFNTFSFKFKILDIIKCMFIDEYS